MNAKLTSAVLAGLAMTCSVAMANYYPLQDNHPALEISVDNQTDHPVSIDGVTIADHSTHRVEVPVDAMVTGSIDADLAHAPAIEVRHTNQVCCAGYFGDLYGDLIEVTINGSTTAVCPTRANSVFNPTAPLTLSFHSDDSNANNEVIMLAPEFTCSRSDHMDENEQGDEFIDPSLYGNINGPHLMTEPRTTDSSELPE